ncbi:hypothetical protein LNN31_10320 [Acetobacterium wieringae]|uniref:PH domain-containing protein n=1 Tax=Acetobacterium wieringae TaxID=52694 RepID=A0ABY6H9L5_9FIRM|nr:hypothetical protein [Acetobacterium wieringae]UYO61180.1 hypothetical protein LNN31_10320 [Acetobacterium wieringae]VUZ29155.1 Uncharacterised protein [Acetobacterium wieringae]
MIKQGWWLLLLIVPAGGALVGGLLLGDELVWGLGLGFSVFGLLFIPVLVLRAKRLGRSETDPELASWSYSRAEARQVARDLLAWQRQRNRWLAPFTAGCLALMGGIFVVVLHQQFPEPPLWQWLWLLLPAGLPWVIRGLYHLYLRQQILSTPCETKIGRHFLIWGNVRPVFNQRNTLTAVAAELDTKTDRHYLKIHYHSTEHLRYGQAAFDDWVCLLVPADRESDARAVIKALQDD